MDEILRHSTAIIETEQIGHGTRIWAFTHLMENVSVGQDCNIGSHCYIESGAVIGNSVTIKNNVMIWNGVVLEDCVFIGTGVVFANDLYPRSRRLPQARKRYENADWLLPTLVQQGASLGIGAIILAGLTIGRFAMIGAGAVVTKDVPSYGLVRGNPAQVRGWVCQCGLPLKFQNKQAACEDCTLCYVKDNDSIRLEIPKES